ncbi:platelet glycoprotein Ib beta chain [Tiliqua scincoides]|uniref:platelet glycoprotein Ib beta chain n=1 Tax=Tiliqua scincoides TaxID=71010 RepID=UPI00346380F6
MNLLWLFLPLGLLSPTMSTCPPPCACTTDIIDCSDKDLTVNNIPANFRPSTTTLYLSYNELTSIPNGLFDQLKSLQKVHLQGNPWDCDCQILYLRSWLHWQQNRSLYRDVVCSSPDHLQGRIISYLTEDEIVATCQSWYCSVAFIVQVCLFIFILVQAILLLLVILFLRRFYRLAKEGKGTYDELYENVDSADD